MVFSKHLYMVILSYILLIIAVAGAGIALIITHTALILGCLFLIISLFFIRALVKQLNKFNAKIRIFLDAMEDKESMILFNEQSADKEMNALIIRKSKFPQNPKRSVRFSGKRTKRSVQKRKARNTQKAETKVL